MQWQRVGRLGCCWEDEDHNGWLRLGPARPILVNRRKRGYDGLVLVRDRRQESHHTMSSISTNNHQVLIIIIIIILTFILCSVGGENVLQRLSKLDRFSEVRLPDTVTYNIIKL